MIGSACMMAVGETIDVADLPEYLRAGSIAAAGPVAAPSEPGPDDVSAR